MSHLSLIGYLVLSLSSISFGDDWDAFEQDDTSSASAEVEQTTPPAEDFSAEETTQDADLDLTVGETEPTLLQEPQQATELNEEIREVAEDPGISDNPMSGKAVHETVADLRNENSLSHYVKWSFGMGLKYYLENDVLLFANIEHLVSNNFGFGFFAGSLGQYEVTSSSSLHGIDLLLTLNLHAQDNFRGLWIQGGAGLAYLKLISSTATSVDWKPCLVGLIGWRWGLNDLAGNDDDFSIAILGGFQSIFSSSAIGPIKTASAALNPVLRFEMNFGF